jgi:threonine aldolase
MGNFDMYFSDKEREEAEAAEKAAEVTTLYGGDPTVEEAQEAFDQMFEESEAAFDKMFKEVWKK